MRRGKLIAAALLCFVLAAAGNLLLRDGKSGEREGFIALLRMSGALRIFAMDVLWLRMSAHLQEGREGLVLSTARTLLTLDPESPRVRIFLHRHLAFTMARKAAGETEREEWIREGLQIMDEALEKEPDCPQLHNGLGFSFFIRTEHPTQAFDKVCLERYGRKPVELAPMHLEKAHVGENRERVTVFWIASLMNAAYHAMESERYAEAARYWERVIDGLPVWQVRVGWENDHGMEEHYGELRDYCIERGRLKKEKDSRPEDVK
jgi:hypothetical protein